MPNMLFRVSIASGALALAMTVPTIAAAQDSSGYRSAPKRTIKVPRPKPSATPAPTDAPAAPPAPPPPPPPPPPPMIGGAPMVQTNTIAQNVMAASNLTTLVELVTAANLGGTLAGPGPYTVFAPDNSGFAALPPTTITALKDPANQATLVRILNYHIVPGALDFATLKAQITAGGGKATLTTAAGVPLTVEVFPLQAGGETLVLTGANGNKAYVTAADIKQSNGIFHVVNGVLSPDGPQPAAAAQPAQ